MTATPLQRCILALMLDRHYRLVGYFAPSGRWHLCRAGHRAMAIGPRTVRSMLDRGLVEGLEWPRVTARGWSIAREARPWRLRSSG